MVRFESVGLVVSIMTFADASSCVTLNSLPAISYAVMLNATGPFGEFCRTEMFAYASVNVYQNSLQKTRYYSTLQPLILQETA